MLRKNIEFKWILAYQQAFDTWKQKLITSPVLSHPDFDKTFVLHTDASLTRLGAVLAQVGKDGKEHSISYASRSTKPAEQNYEVTELECLTMVWAIKYFHKYLFCHFTLVTDHKALIWMRNKESPNRRIQWWILSIDEYDFTIIHQAGIKYQNTDVLLRLSIQY